MEQRDGESVMGNAVAAKKQRIARGTWSMQQKLRMVAEAQAPGADRAAIAQRHGVRLALLSSWRRRLSGATKLSAKPARFAAVRIGAAADGVIEIDLVNRCIRVRGIVDAQMLREVLAATR